MTELQQHQHQRQPQGAIAVVGAASSSTSSMAAAPSSTSTAQHHQQASSALVVETPPAAATQILQPRFEDLTIDDDLPLLPRLQRYIQSSIALQRLVHVRMLGEVALELGQQLTATELVPLLPPLVKDGESIIRQRLCNEIKILCLVLMGLTKMKESPLAVQAPHHEHLSRKGGDQPPPPRSSLPQIPNPTKSSKYYKVMVHHLFPHLYTLISDPDNEVRRAASENIVKLALRIDKDDVVPLALSIPLRLVKEGQARASAALSTPGTSAGGGSAGDSNAQSSGTALAAAANNKTSNTPTITTTGTNAINPRTTAEELLITASNLLADLSSFLPPPRLPPEVTTRYLSPTILTLADDPNFRVRRAAVQALPRMLGSASLDDVKRRLLPKFVALSADEMYRVRKASGECLVDVSRALVMLPWRLHFRDVWMEEEKKELHDDATMAKMKGSSSGEVNGEEELEQPTKPVRKFYKLRTEAQIHELLHTIHECHEIRRRTLCVIAKRLLEDTNKFIRYGMMQFLGPLIASFYPLDRGSMIGSMGGMLYNIHHIVENKGSSSSKNVSMGTLGIGVESVDIAKDSTGLERASVPGRAYYSTAGGGGGCGGEFNTIDNFLSYNHSLHGLEIILHGESALSHAVLEYGGGCNANKDPFGTMGPQFFPHANGMVGRSSALDDDDTDSFLLKACMKAYNQKQGVVASSSSTTLPYPALMSGRPDPDDLKVIANTLLNPYIAMASCHTGEESTDAEMRVYCAYSLPAVVLLFGGSDWEKDGLKRCYLDLLGMKNGSEEQDPSTGISADATTLNENKALGPPLPVKRCLASSVHAVAHMLGPEIVSKDTAFLTAFEKSFLRDPDEAIRLNILKNLASFLGAMPAGGDGAGHRDAYLPILHSIIMGDEVLGATKRRSASNPGVLNWRQRDAVAKVLPDVIVLFDAHLNHEYLWPILKTLLTDTVSAVRENAGWSVPVLLRKYLSNQENSSEWIFEVTSWLRETFLDVGSKGSLSVKKSSRGSSSARRLKKQTTSSEGAFSRRQGYCRILSTVALAMRMGEGEDGEGDRVNLANSSQYANGQGLPSIPIDPFDKMPQLERDQFRLVMLRDLLPPALEMALDCVANVRLTLTKCLKLLPADLRKESHVEEVLSTLEEELMTWDVGDMMPNQGEYQFDQP
ncbi:hypothetical protein ACHAXH_002382 [Discostella pseudostelligera]